MKINLLAVGTRMPAWVNAGFEEYQKRLPADYKLQLTEVTAAMRSKDSIVNKLLEKEGEALLARVPRGNKIVCLDANGKSWNNKQLAEQLRCWHDESQDISILIGGPDGLAEKCKQQASLLLSLSPLTLPHPLVRIVLAEQLYRAWTIINGHPYHR